MVSFGVVKVNVDTDNQSAFTRALAGDVLEHREGVLKVDGGIGDKHSMTTPAGRWSIPAESRLTFDLAGRRW
jgi:fructose/tagatose bisphosphate aldolase